MANPAIALGGLEEGVDFAAKVQEKELKYFSTIQRHQKKVLSEEQAIAPRRKELMAQTQTRGPNRYFHNTITHRPSDKTLKLAHMEHMDAEIEELRAEVEAKDRYKEELVNELHKQRAAYEREKAQRKQHQLDIAKTLAQAKELELEKQRERWEEKQSGGVNNQLEQMEAQIAKQKETMAAHQEALKAAKERREKIKKEFLKSKQHGAKETVDKATQLEKRREEKLQALQRKHFEDQQRKEQQREERKEKLRAHMMKLALEQEDQRQQAWRIMQEKEERTERALGQNKATHSMTVAEREKWRKYVAKRMVYQDKLDETWRGHIEQKVSRTIKRADELNKRKEQVKLTYRESHMRQAEMYNANRDVYVDAKINIRQSKGDAKLPDLKPKPPPPLKPMKIPEPAVMPEIKFAMTAPSMPTRLTFRKQMVAGQMIVSENQDTINKLRATMP